MKAPKCFTLVRTSTAIGLLVLTAAGAVCSATRPSDDGDAGASDAGADDPCVDAGPLVHVGDECLDGCGDDEVCEDHGCCGSRCVPALVEGSRCGSEARGEQCAFETECPDGYACFRASYLQFFCYRPGEHPTGAPCSQGSDCASGRCAGGESPSCTVPECEVDADCATGVCLTAGCGDAFCIPPRQVGETCYSVGPDYFCVYKVACAEGLECMHTMQSNVERTGECVVPGDVGAPCSVPFTAPTGVEVDGCSDGLVCGDDRLCRAP